MNEDYKCYMSKINRKYIYLYDFEDSNFYKVDLTNKIIREKIRINELPDDVIEYFMREGCFRK